MGVYYVRTYYGGAGMYSPASLAPAAELRDNVTAWYMRMFLPFISRCMFQRCALPATANRRGCRDPPPSIFIELLPSVSPDVLRVDSEVKAGKTPHAPLA